MTAAPNTSEQPQKIPAASTKTSLTSIRHKDELHSLFVYIDGDLHNCRLEWSLVYHEDAQPKVLATWRTTAINENALKNLEDQHPLELYLNREARNVVFGKEEFLVQVTGRDQGISDLERVRRAAVLWRATFIVSPISVYCVANSTGRVAKEQVKKLHWLLEGLPLRLVVLESDEFLVGADALEQEMPSALAACCLPIVESTQEVQRPKIVWLSSGPSMMYVAFDKMGNIYGMGSTHGLSLKCAMASIDYPEKIEEEIENRKAKKEAPTLNGSDDSTSEITRVLRETASYICDVMEEWQSSWDSEEEGGMVYLRGSDAVLLEPLLKAEHSHTLPKVHSVVQEGKFDLQPLSDRNAVLGGVLRKLELLYDGPCQVQGELEADCATWNQLLGQRIALSIISKTFRNKPKPVMSDVARGSVVEIVRQKQANKSEYKCRVFWDHHPSMDLLSLDEVKEGLSTYEEKRESFASPVDLDQESQELLKKKREQAAKGNTALKEWIASSRKRLADATEEAPPAKKSRPDSEPTTVAAKPAGRRGTPGTPQARATPASTKATATTTTSAKGPTSVPASAPASVSAAAKSLADTNPSEGAVDSSAAVASGASGAEATRPPMVVSFTTTEEMSTVSRQTNQRIVPNEVASAASLPDSARSSSAVSVARSSKKRVDPLSFINRRVAKDFDEGLFFGTVQSYDSKQKWFRIVYDDGDEEDFVYKMLRFHLDYYDRVKHKDVQDE